jgi:integrase/recombinase XerD
VSKRKAPTGCFWRGGIIWGRAKVKGIDRKWSLHTDDPKVARARRKDGKDRLVAAAYHGDARVSFNEVLASWATWIEKQVSHRTSARYACSLGRLEPFLEGRFLDEITGKLIAEIIRARQTAAFSHSATSP